ncbi:MAG: hypothetical protein JNK79_04890 [Chitinophagaceae bacterium]|nr:hypothetical protein [Chitinophagaceae bacterium]
MKHFISFSLAVLMCSMVVAQQPNVNYDEHKVKPYTLPQVLKTNGGRQVTTKEIWEKQRRREILKLFEDNVYGQMPHSFDSINFTVSGKNNSAYNGRAKLKEVDIEVFRNSQSVVIHLLLFIPKSKSKPGVFLLINNRGKENTDATRQTKSEFWPVEMVVDSGFAIASFHVSDLAPDNKDSFTNGALRLYPEQASAENGMRAIGAWAWGASRVLDYLETDKDIDAKKVAVVGHSRGGKAALWAAAQDRRFAMCISNCSGNSGAKLSKRNFGETVAIINTAFPHWFSPNYKKYNDDEQALPVDQHMLISLIAPRPVYATNASEDLWADPTGTFLALKHAEEVYELYGIKPGLPMHPPAIDHPVNNSRVAYHNRTGIHNMIIYDWRNFVVFGKRFLK